MAAQSIETTIGMTRQDIPEAVWSFYDPNGTLASSKHPEDALLSWLDSKRQQPLDLPHIGTVATRQLVAMELAHIGVITPENTQQHVDWLDLRPDDIEQATEAAQAYAEQTARFCLSAVSRIRHQHGLGTRDGSDITLSGAVLSANAHRGQTRVVGNRPYYSHPRAVALLLRSAFDNHLADTSDPSLPIYEFKGLLHDGFEDEIPRDGSSFLSATNLLVSPLVIAETLKGIGIEDATAWRIPLGMLALVKTVGFNREKMAYPKYIERFQRYAEEIPVKLADLQHNYRIDSKSPDLIDPSKNHKLYMKREEYYQAQQALLQFYSNSDQVTGDDWLQKQLFAANLLKLNHDDLENTMRQTKWSQIAPNELVEYFESEQQAA